MKPKDIKKDIKKDAHAILDSEELDILLDAVEIMAKVQSNLLSLQHSVDELKTIMDNACVANDDFSVHEDAVIYDTINEVENLVENLAHDDSNPNK